MALTSAHLAGGGHGQPIRRVLEAEWQESDRILEFRIVGDGFLRGMVRSIVGTLLDVGRGRVSVAEFETLLQGRPRGEAGPTAAAQGLVLHRVHYPAEWGLGGPISGVDDVLD